MCVAGLIYCICTTGVSQLMFYGLSKSTDMLVVFLPITHAVNVNTSQKKCRISKKQKSANYAKTADPTKNKVIFGLTAPKNMK